MIDWFNRIGLKKGWNGLIKAGDYSFTVDGVSYQLSINGKYDTFSKLTFWLGGEEIVLSPGHGKISTYFVMYHNYYMTSAWFPNLKKHVYYKNKQFTEILKIVQPALYHIDGITAKQQNKIQIKKNKETNDISDILSRHEVDRAMDDILAD